MKIISIILTTFICLLCKAQSIDSTKYKIEISQWSDNNDCYSWFDKYLKNRDSEYSFFSMDLSNKSEGFNNKYNFIKGNSNSDTIYKAKVKFNFPVDDYIETSNAFYTINASRNTMNEDDGTFLSKYNKKWKLIWSKKIRASTAPDDDFVLTITDKNELLIISDDHWYKGRHPNIRIERRDIDGKLLYNKILFNKHSYDIHSLLKTSDKNFLISSTFYNSSTEKPYLELIKISQYGKVIWQKQYSEMHIEQSLITKDNSMFFFGNGLVYDSLKNVFHRSLKTISIDSSGKLIFAKSIDSIECEYEANCVSETNEGTFVFSSYVTNKTNTEKKIYLFELNKKGETIFEKYVENKPTTDLHIFKNNNSDVLLANSYYTPNWYYKHNFSIQFIKLSK